MKVSLPWLKRFVNFKQSASELADLLTMLGFESEVVTDFSVLENIVVGEVESSKKHPNADKLKFCVVNDGKMTHEVVCGAPNVATGQKIVFAKVGAVLPGDFKIGKAKIRGIESNGMICSERELGISDMKTFKEKLSNMRKYASNLIDNKIKMVGKNGQR